MVQWYNGKLVNCCQGVLDSLFFGEKPQKHLVDSIIYTTFAEYIYDNPKQWSETKKYGRSYNTAACYPSSSPTNWRCSIIVACVSGAISMAILQTPVSLHRTTIKPYSTISESSINKRMRHERRLGILRKVTIKKKIWKRFCWWW